MTRKRSAEYGGLFFYLLLCIALFGALGFAFSRNSGISGISEEKAALLASEILYQTQLVDDQVSKIRLRGFNKDQVTFTNSIVSGYSDNCAGDQACRVFSTSGLAWLTPPAGSNNSAYPWVYTGDAYLIGFGAHAVGELMMILPAVTDPVCKALNVKVGLTPSVRSDIPIQSATWFAHKFGNYSTARFGGGPPSPPEIDYKGQFCVKMNGLTGGGVSPALTNTNMFLSVLLAN